MKLSKKIIFVLAAFAIGGLTFAETKAEAERRFIPSDSLQGPSYGEGGGSGVKKPTVKPNGSNGNNSGSNGNYITEEDFYHRQYKGYDRVFGQLELKVKKQGIAVYVRDSKTKRSYLMEFPEDGSVTVKQLLRLCENPVVVVGKVVKNKVEVKEIVPLKDNPYGNGHNGPYRK